MITLASSVLSTPLAQQVLTGDRWENGYRGGGGGGGFVVGLLWLLLVGFAVSWFLRRRGRGPLAGGPGSAQSLLADRYARGEIGDEEYRTRLEVLRSAGRRRKG